jgi:hypothetical protein
MIDLAKGPSCKTEEAKRKAESAMVYAAVLIKRLLSERGAEDDSVVSSEHCIVFHSHRPQRVCTSSGYRTILKNMHVACRDIERAWPTIEPPSGFDPLRASRRVRPTNFN